MCRLCASLARNGDLKTGTIENKTLMNNKITKIVLTGGPCAGKTTAMELIVSHFSAQGIAVLVVPEVATMFANSGVDFTTPNRQMFLESERQLLEFQMELEDR